tara:strand:- start:177 stop:923 length:747 start_codon:yes stop_codon:yes gene_type:complete
MTDKLNWQEFRSSHKLPASKKEYKSAMWAAYKADDKEAYQKAAEEAEFEIPEAIAAWITGPKSEVQKLKESKEATDTADSGDDASTEVEEPEEEVKEVVKKKPLESEETLEMFREYSKTMQQLHRFPHAYTPQQKREMEARLVEIADLTRPPNYRCTPTDGWQIWFGPTQACLLINTTRKLAFTCSRAWWTRRYLNARYVDNQLVHDVKNIDRMRKEYELRKKLVKRAPLPNVEIMVPTTASEYQMRG